MKGSANSNFMIYSTLNHMAVLAKSNEYFTNVLSFATFASSRTDVRFWASAGD